MQLLSLIYEPAPNEKQIYSIVSHFRETRGSSDHVGQLQNVERKKSKKKKKITYLKENIFENEEVWGELRYKSVLGRGNFRR